MLTRSDYCDLDLSVMLARLGYDERCRAFFDPLCKCFNLARHIGYTNSEGKDIGVIACPLLYEAQDWLRRDGIHVQIQIVLDGPANNRVVKYISSFIVVNEDEMAEGVYGKVAHSTYQEALKEGIADALKYLDQSKLCTEQ